MAGGIEGESPGELTSQTNQPEETQHRQKSLVHNPTGEKKTGIQNILSKMREEIGGDGRGVFKCALPKIIFSPFEIQRKYDHVITKEQAIEEGQAWVENLKTLDEQSLEKKLQALERFKQNTFPRIREAYRTPQQAELLEHQIEIVREQLRQREVD
jgi:hypothetical protein